MNLNPWAILVAAGSTFLRRPLKPFLVNAGYQVVSFVVMEGIPGAWK